MFRERNLGKIVRFSTLLRLKDENVAEHCFHTTLYAMMLADMEIEFGNKVDVEKVMRMALLHDIEEAMTGDILHSFKYSDKELLNSIKKMGHKFYVEMLHDLPKNLSKKYSKVWNDFDSTIESRIVEAADKLEALIYAMEELSSGNKAFKRVKNTLISFLEKINIKSVKTILSQLKKSEWNV